MGPGQQMGEPDETAEQARPVEVRAKYGDAAAAVELAAFPVAACGGIEMRCDEPIIGGHVRGQIFAGEKAHEIALRRPHRGDESPPEPGSEVRMGVLIEDTVVVPGDGERAG